MSDRNRSECASDASDPPTAAAVRARRARAAQALAASPLRARLGWDDLGGAPDWLVMEESQRAALARAGAAWLHAGAFVRSIDGAWLKQARAVLGDGLLSAVLAADAADDAAAPALPAPDGLADWLDAQGRALLLATLASANLRDAVRDRLWPAATTLPAGPELARATRALQAARSSLGERRA